MDDTFLSHGSSQDFSAAEAQSTADNTRETTETTESHCSGSASIPCKSILCLLNNGLISLSIAFVGSASARAEQTIYLERRIGTAIVGLSNSSGNNGPQEYLQVPMTDTDRKTAATTVKAADKVFDHLEACRTPCKDLKHCLIEVPSERKTSKRRGESARPFLTMWLRPLETETWRVSLSYLDHNPRY